MTDKDIETDDIDLDALLGNVETMVDVEIDDTPELEKAEPDQDDDDDDDAKPDDDDIAPGDADDDDDHYDEEAEAKKERRRLERLEKKQRRKYAENKTKEALVKANEAVEYERNRAARLEERLYQLAQSVEGSQIRQIDADIQQYNTDFDHVVRVLKQAEENQDEAAYYKALRVKDGIIQAYHKAMAAKQNYQQTAQSQVPLSQQRVASFQKDFMARNPWFNPNDPTDKKSAMALKVDQELAASGMKPDTVDYWLKLESDVNRRLNQEAPAPRKPVGGPQLASSQKKPARTVSIPDSTLAAWRSVGMTPEEIKNAARDFALASKHKE